MITVIKVNTYTTRYEWETDENGDTIPDGPAQLGTDEDYLLVDPDMDVDEGMSLGWAIANAMLAHGATEASCSPEWGGRGTWYSGSYEHPYTGVIEETTYHLPDGLSEDVHREVYQRITSR